MEEFEQKNIKSRENTKQETHLYMSMDELLKYMKSVRIIARQIKKTLPPYVTMTLGDLEQEGFLGLVKANEIYDPGKGMSFKNYAESKIRFAILDALEREDYLSEPTRRVVERIKDILGENEVKKGMGLTPLSSQEIANNMGMDEKKYESYLALALSGPNLSLDAGVNKDSDDAFADYIVDHEVENPGELVDREARKEAVESAVSSFFRSVKPTKRRNLLRHIYKQRFYENKGLKDIGNDLNLSESYISLLLTEIKKGLEKKLKSEGFEKEGLVSKFYNKNSPLSF